MSQGFEEVVPFEEQQSIEIPNSCDARKLKLTTTGENNPFPNENLKTTWNAVLTGRKISENGLCFGWRNSRSSYSWITYNQFIKRAENFGAGLIKIGMNPGQLSNVGIYAQNSVEWAVAQYGIWSQSAVLIPLYDSLGSDASLFMISHAEIEVVVCDQEQKVINLLARKSETPTLKYIITMDTASQELKTLAKENDMKLFSLREVEEIGEKHLADFLYPQTTDIAIICYTSGTTGEPKGAMLTHKNLMSICASTFLSMRDTALSKEDTVISYLPLAHIYGQVIQLVMLMAGVKIGFFSGDINQLTGDMIMLQPTIFPAVPSLLNKMYDKAQYLVRSKLKIDIQGYNSTMETELKSICKPFIDSLGGKIRLIYSGAAPIVKNVLEFYTKILGCTVLEGYGLTECTGICTVALRHSESEGSVGSPISCCTVKLVDVPEMEYYSKDSKGEICINGPGIFKGYFKDPKKTAETLDSDGWLHTGDIGMWLPNGTLKIIDRKKNILKLSQGLYVALEKIECVYARSSFVSQIFVHGDSLKSVLFAIVIPEKEVLLHWYNQNMKKSVSWNGICKDHSVKDLIFEDLLRVGRNAGLHSFEQVKAIHLHPEVLTYEAGFLTPTSKLKRDVCKKQFTEEILTLINSI